MSADEPFTPPKKKPSIFWWIGGAVFVLAALFIFQLFGPSPAIIVSRQTTFITEPLRSNGLPDFNRHLLNVYRDGVTPENNAAALLWPALWPGELDPPQYAMVAKELGLSTVPQKSDAAQFTYRYIRGMVNAEYTQIQSHTRGSSTAEAGNTDDNRLNEIEARFDKLSDRIYGRPWTSREIPQMAKWVHDNQKPLDMMVEASHRSRCYFPSPTLLENQNEPVTYILLPGQQTAREAARSLVVRAMWNIGEHHNAEAWRDLLAIHRLGRLMAQGPLLIEQFVGFAMAGIGRDGTLQLLHEGNLSPEDARIVMRDLAALPSFSNVADMLDNSHRLFLIDNVIQFSRKNMDARSMDQLKLSQPIRFANHLNVDWNVVLRKGNEYFDRYTKAARLPTYAARRQALRQINKELAGATMEPSTASLIASAINPSERSKTVAAALVGAMMPAVDAAVYAQERTNANLEVLRLAAALAVYRADHKNYPDKLDDLVPTILAKLPVDLFTASPFKYKRIDDGYLLYSLGPNGIDNGGNSENEGLYEGVSISEMANGESVRTKIPAGSDDFAIRVPLPPIEVPPLPEH
ncbi:MAG TPA: hypothetical protein VH107_14640 [Lacipirellulaceae bacterium]|jgi:hypothetical protein|nr:hypothetical protein [Lacipirellulaceae bacterium]